jgi:antitoxin (DNA-binding transcriptional repressor) of toxin-antitoxin stability system
MKTVTKRELNQQTAKVLSAVEAGETVLVTERGVAKWRIESAQRPVDLIARLESEGRLVRASRTPAPWPDGAVPGRRYTRAEVDALADWTRDDR